MEDPYFDIVQTVETIHPVEKKRKRTPEDCRNKKLARFTTNVTNLQNKIKVLEKTILALQQNLMKYQDEANRRLFALEGIRTSPP